MTACPFCALDDHDLVLTRGTAVARLDGFPVSPGHTLVIPRRHVATYFEATGEEQRDLWRAVDAVKRKLDERVPPPDGYNVGFNAGAAAGQTVMHLHVHVIPRYRGDVDDPRGGVRHVIPAKGNYLQDRAPPLARGGEADPFARHLAPLFAQATRVDIVAAFVQESGTRLVLPQARRAVLGGAHVRLLTGDYLGITRVEALERLLDFAASSAARHDPSQPAAADGAGDDDEPADDRTGTFEARVVETGKLAGGARSFHPKSWIFEGPLGGIAFVGSSNVSHSALETGIEWNLRVESARDPQAYAAVRVAFDDLWQHGVPLSEEWIRDYERRARPAGAAAAWLPAEERPETPQPLPDPNLFQREALEALRQCRDQGRRRALVVLPTGLGKTLLAAFDVAARAGSIERLPRVLVVAHRVELLEQAAGTLRRALEATPYRPRPTWLAGGTNDLTGNIVLAAIQKAARPKVLAALCEEHRVRPFEYVIVDEVHHAHAASYRRLIDALEPPFLLGLTATPERADQGDVVGIFDDRVAYRAELGAAIAADYLVPFTYHGVKDDIDYVNIPWRNKRFDLDMVGRAAQTERRMETLWQKWQACPGSRTLVFCCTIEHARYAAAWLRARDLRVACIHSGKDSDERSTALDRLARGELDAICSVDVFNEGIDVPMVDRVVMLRPTESPVLFMQQLGRGLRKAEGKSGLVVIDFVGNHRVFLDRVRHLISLGARTVSLRDFLSDRVEAELPPGCAVDLELEVKELLRSLLPGGGDLLQQAYREIKASRGARPTAAEIHRLGLHLSRLPEESGGWFDFVAAEGDLDAAQLEVLRATRGWFVGLAREGMTKSFKMVVLEALLEAGALTVGMDIDELATRSRAIIERSPELRRDIEGVKALEGGADAGGWLAYWRKNPLAAWTGARREARWFELEGDRFVSRVSCPPGDEEVLAGMTRELVDYQLARYRARRRSGAEGQAFECAVTWNQRDPILKLPPRRDRPDLPAGDLDVRTPDGTPWRFRLAKEFCNVARPAGADRNELPDLLRRWFGVNAGHPGTHARVRFRPSPDGWWIEPAAGKILAMPARERGRVVAFPDLRVAAGAVVGARESPDAADILLPIADPADTKDLFAVRATGDSMDGGPQPIRDGDWMLFRYARSAPLGTVSGRIALVQSTDGTGTVGYMVKRVLQDGERWTLCSENPLRPSLPATADTVVIAVLHAIVRPEELGPEVGALLPESEMAERLGATPPLTTGRHGGQLVIVVDKPGGFAAPDRIPQVVYDRRPGESAHVVARIEGAERLRYCGVARWDEESGGWTLPELDFATWRALGGGRSCSRRLPRQALESATAFQDELQRTAPPGTWMRHGDRRCRIAAHTSGGVRIDGGPTGMKERLVSTRDIAWVCLARDDAKHAGGVLDEARVNRLRCLDGTPRESTRWIDTGWAIVLVNGAR